MKSILKTHSAPSFDSRTKFRVTLPNNCILRFIQPREFSNPHVYTLREMSDTVRNNFNHIAQLIEDKDAMTCIGYKLDQIIGDEKHIDHNSAIRQANALTFIQSLNHIATGAKDPRVVMKKMIHVLNAQRRPIDWVTTAKSADNIARLNHRSCHYSRGIHFIATKLEQTNPNHLKSTIIQIEKKLENQGTIKTGSLGKLTQFNDQPSIRTIEARPTYEPSKEVLKDIYYDPIKNEWAHFTVDISPYGYLETGDKRTLAALYVDRNGELFCWNIYLKQYHKITHCKLRTYTDPEDLISDKKSKDSLPKVDNRLDVINGKTNSYRVLFLENKAVVEAIMQFRAGQVGLEQITASSSRQDQDSYSDSTLL